MIVKKPDRNLNACKPNMRSHKIETKKVGKLPSGLRVLFIAYMTDIGHTRICQLVKRELQTSFPTITCEILELEEKVYVSLFDGLFDKGKIEFARKAIKRFRPHVIVVTTDTGSAATFIKLARILCIPTLVIQATLMAESPYIGDNYRKSPLDLLQWKNFLLWRFLCLISHFSLVEKLSIFVGWRVRAPEWGLSGADLYAVWGDYVKQLLVSRGVSPQKIEVTGNPLFDEIHSKSDFEKQEVRRRLGLGKGSVILLATQPFVEGGFYELSTHVRFVTSVINAAKRLDMQLIIKLHPRESVKKYDSIIHKAGYNKIVIVQKFDLHELIDLSDIVITITSTVGLWTLAHGKPLISLNCFQLPYFNQYNDEDIAIVLNDLNILPEVLKKIIENEQSKSELIRTDKEKIRHYIYRIDRMASKRIVKLIINLSNR